MSLTLSSNDTTDPDKSGLFMGNASYMYVQKILWTYFQSIIIIIIILFLRALIFTRWTDFLLKTKADLSLKRLI